MKRFILPLQSILLMLLLIGCADINTTKTADNYIHPIEQNKMPTETTEQMFYDFVRYDLLKGLELTSDTILYFVISRYFITHCISNTIIKRLRLTQQTCNKNIIKCCACI